MFLPRRRAASGLTYGILVGLVAVVAITAISNAGGSVNRLFGTVAGRIANPAPDRPTPTPDQDPDPVSFPSVSIAPLTPVESAIRQLRNHTGVTVSVSSGEFQICSDAACSAVTSAYGTTARRVETDQYIRLRTTSGAAGSSPADITVTMGSQSAVWTVSVSLGTLVATFDGSGLPVLDEQGCTNFGISGFYWKLGRSVCKDRGYTDVSHILLTRGLPDSTSNCNCQVSVSGEVVTGYTANNCSGCCNNNGSGQHSWYGNLSNGFLTTSLAGLPAGISVDTTALAASYTANNANVPRPTYYCR